MRVNYNKNSFCSNCNEKRRKNLFLCPICGKRLRHRAQPCRAKRYRKTILKAKIDSRSVFLKSLNLPIQTIKQDMINQ